MNYITKYLSKGKSNLDDKTTYFITLNVPDDVMVSSEKRNQFVVDGLKNFKDKCRGYFYKYEIGSDSKYYLHGLSYNDENPNLN